MNRIEILQKLIDENNFKSYLEIGTFKGESFLPLKCKKKIAVDPKFQILKRDKLKWMWRNPFNIRNHYFEMTSNKFFESQEDLLHMGIDLIFIDGLHTFKASLNDCLNSLKYLNQNGLIVIHDCFPPNRAAATPAKSFEAAENMNIEGWKKEWCGDVWKTIVYLKKHYVDCLDIHVIDTDYGLGVIKFKLENNITAFEVDKALFKKINSLSYDNLISNPSELIGLEISKKSI